MKFRIIILLFLCAFLFSSAAAQLSGKNRWVNVKSKNFNIIGDATEKDLRDVAKQLEQFREAFRMLFRNMNHNSSVDTNVVVFRNASSYRPFRPKRPDGKPDEGIAGYFQPGEARNYITLSTEYSKEDTYGTIFHEYIHYLMDANLGRAELPAWFNEGIAGYYQTFKIVDDQKVYLGELRLDHIELLRTNKLMPFRDFLNVDNYSLHGTGGRTRSVFYAQAWLFMHFLMHSENGAYKDRLNAFINLRRRDVEEAEAFRQAFNVDHETLEAALQKYLNQRTMAMAGYDLGKKLVFDSEMQVVPLSEAEANTYLGDLLYHSHDYTAAEAYLNKGLELDPRSFDAMTSLGLVKMRQRKFEDARRLLESAAASKTPNYYTLYNFAYVLSRESMDEFGYVREYSEDDRRRMQAALRTSIKLKPDFAENYNLLAFVSLVSGSDLDEAIGFLQQALKVQPGNQYYAIQMARIYLRQNKIDQARRIAESLSKNASKQELKSNADQLLSTIAQMESLKQVNEEQRAEFEGLGLKRRTFVNRESISPEEAERLEKERELRNLNHLIEKPAQGETQIIGKIKRINCSGGSVRFEVEAESGSLILSSKDFESVSMQILHQGTRNLEVGCGANIGAETVVINYREHSDQRQRVAGVISAVSFVPENFRLMSKAELNKPEPIVVGGPPTDLNVNEDKIKAEMEEMIAKQREFHEIQQRQSIIDQIISQLRQPQTGELRGTGALDRIECTNKARTAVVTFNKVQLRLRMPEKPEDLKLALFVRDVNPQITCGTNLSDIKAIITYLPDAKPKGKIVGELRALELVPPSVEIQ